MKVKELRELLDQFDEDYIVLMSKDCEGNKLRHVEEVGLFETFEHDGKEVYRRAEDPGDFEDDTVVVIWPGW